MPKDKSIPKSNKRINKEKKKEDHEVELLVDIASGATGYMGNPLLKRANEKIAWTPEYIQEYKKCAEDPIYFSRYCTIVTLDKGKQKIQLYDYQKKAIESYKDNRFCVTCSCRQSGKCCSGKTLITLRHDSYKNGQPFDIEIGAFYDLLEARTPKSFFEPDNPKFIEGVLLSEGWEISTDKGFKPVSILYKTVLYERVVLITENHQMECADTHIVFDQNMNQVFVEDLKSGDIIMTDTGPEQVIAVEGTNLQENMYDISVEDSNHRYWSNGILSHNTTTLVVFFLWYVLFHNDMSVAILANKGRTAQMIISRIQLAYMYLPKFLQQGIPDGGWNKQSFHLENGSRVISAATSSDSIRGDSFNVIYVDECVGEDTMITVRNKDTGEIEKIPIKDLWERL